MPMTVTAEQQHAERAGHPVDELLHVLAGPVLVVVGEDRHEGLGKGALREPAPEDVGNLERHEEGVHQERGAEQPRVDHVAHQAEQPRQQGHGADGGGGLQQVPSGDAGGAAGEGWPGIELRKVYHAELSAA